MPSTLANVLIAVSCLIYLGSIIWAIQKRQKIARGVGAILALNGFLFLAGLVRLLSGLNLWNGLVRSETQARFPLYAALGIAILIFEATAIFLQGRPPHWAWRALSVVWIGAAVLLNENINGILMDRIPAGGWVFSRPALGAIFLAAGWALFSATAIFQTYATRRQTIHPLHRNRYVFWFAVLFYAIVGVFLSFAVSVWLSLDALITLQAVLLMDYLLSTHDLPDLRYSVNRSLASLISALIAIAVMAGFLLLIQYLTKISPLTQPVQFLPAVLAAAAIALALNPILARIQAWLSRVIVDRKLDAGRLLGEYSRKIATIIELPHLAEVVLTTVRESLDLTDARLFLINICEEEVEWVEVGQENTAQTPTLRLSLQNPVVVYLQSEHAPLAQYDIDLLPRFRSASAPEAQLLKGLATDLYVSLIFQGSWIGLLSLSAKRSGHRYFERELFFLESLAGQTAMALNNARLYEDLKARNTENERLNQDLTVANRELSRLDQAKSDFIDIASHELRTPLTQIIGYNDMLGDMLSHGEDVQDLGIQMTDSVRKAARRLEEIVDAMFDVSRLDLSVLELSLAPTSLAVILDEAAGKWKEALEIRHQALVLQDLSGLPALFADGKRLVQVFSHLIQNAIKYTPDQGEIRISGQCIAEDGENEQEWIEIVVADTGIGIAPEDHDLIFEKFFRVGSILAHSSGEIKFKGAGPGLGLPLCKGIVEAHGGRVWVESACHDEVALPGSRFHVFLPVVTRAAPVLPGEN